MVGNAPSEEAATAFRTVIEADGGTAQITLAKGDITESWSADVLALIKIVAPLEEWRIAIDGNRARVTGLTFDRDLKAVVEDALKDGLPGALEGQADIALGPLVVTAAMLDQVIAPFRTCGDLGVKDVPSAGFGQGEVIAVTGTLPSTQARVALYDKLREMVGDRTVRVDTEVLNDALCKVEGSLPKAPPGGFALKFGFGKRPGVDNPSARYFVGEEPVIDLVIPAGVTDGFLTVIIIDVSDTVINLLPRRTNPDSSVAALRAGQGGDVTLRLTYPYQEALDDPLKTKIGFQVGDDALGKSKIVVIHSDRPLFDVMEPRSTETQALVKALKELQTNPGIRSVDSFILTTAAN